MLEHPEGGEEEQKLRHCTYDIFECLTDSSVIARLMTFGFGPASANTECTCIIDRIYGDKLRI